MGANKESQGRLLATQMEFGSLSLLNNLAYSYSLHTGVGCIKIKKKSAKNVLAWKPFYPFKLVH